MKILVYAHSEILVSDPIAYTTIEYAVTLAQSGLADRVTVPTFDTYGGPDEVTLVLGPALPLLAHNAPTDEMADNPKYFTDATRSYLRDIGARTTAVRAGLD